MDIDAKIIDLIDFVVVDFEGPHHCLLSCKKQILLYSTFYFNPMLIFSFQNSHKPKKKYHLPHAVLFWVAVILLFSASPLKTGLTIIIAFIS